MPFNFDFMAQSISDCLNEIQRETGLNFRINSAENLKEKTTTKFDNIVLKDILKTLLHPYNFKYTIQEDTLLIAPDNQKMNRNKPEFKKDTICRYYDLDSRCTKSKNRISDYCHKHYLLTDKISQQENILRKAKELMIKIEDAYRRSNQQLLSNHYGAMDEILQYPFKVEWIKIEMDDIRQRYHKIKNFNRTKNHQNLLKKALNMKATMINNFKENKHVACISEYKKLTNLLTNDDNIDNIDPEIKAILFEARQLKEKAKIHVEFAQLPLEVVGIIWIEKHPEESVAIINGKVRGINDFVPGAAFIKQIRKGEVIFSYRGQNVSKELKH